MGLDYDEYHWFLGGYIQWQILLMLLLKLNGPTFLVYTLETILSLLIILILGDW
jgi:hypothetical protein